MDIAAIGSALAARFSSANVTPPAGYDNVALATHELPNAITTTPTVLVFPPEVESFFSGHKRSTNLLFPVRWYIAQTSDKPRAIAALLAWYGVLLDQLEAQFDLGLTSGGVSYAVVSTADSGVADYAEVEYAMIQLDVLVHVEEGYAPTTS